MTFKGPFQCKLFCDSRLHELYGLFLMLVSKQNSDKSWILYDKYMTKMISLLPKGQNKPSKLELVLYNLISEFCMIYPVDQCFLSCITVFHHKWGYANHMSKKMQYNDVSQPLVHRLLVAYKASEGHPKKKFAELLIYMGGHARVYNTYMHGYKYIFSQRLHIDATCSSMPEQFLLVAVSVCR